MILIKTPKEIEIMREGGRRHARVIASLSTLVAPGISSLYLEEKARELIKREGGSSAFLGYTPRGAQYPYPAALCLSINDEVVHGIPNAGEKILKAGDIVSLDLGFVYKGLITDMAITVPVGKVLPKAKKLLADTEKALYAGIKVIKMHGTTGDIGAAVEAVGKKGKYGIVDILAGHGVGRKVHEDPFVPNFGKKGTGEKLVPGMTIAIEPMFNEGTKQVIVDEDGYTYRTKDGKLSAHFEHTVVITEKGAEILTKI